MGGIAAYFTSTVGMALAGVCALLALALGVQTIRVGSWQKDHAELEQKYKDDTGKLALDAAVQRQKAATWQQQAISQAEAAARAKALSAKLAESLAKLQTVFDKQRADDAARIANIVNYKPSGTDCQEAIKQVQGLAVERKRL